MANYVTAIKTRYGDTQIDYNALANIPRIGGKDLKGDIQLSATDIGAVPKLRTINGYSLDSNIKLDAEDVGAAKEDHDHDDVYSKSDHNHDKVYATKSEATEIAPGLMSADDKKKLNSLSSSGGSANITIDSALSDSSTNPVQNKVVNQAITDARDHTNTSIEALGIASGTWTPYFKIGDTIRAGGGGTSGYYVKVNNMINITASIIMSQSDSASLADTDYVIKIGGDIFNTYPPAGNVGGGGVCYAAGLINSSFNGFMLTANDCLITPKRTNPIGGLADVAFGDMETYCCITMTYKIKENTNA